MSRRHALAGAIEELSGPLGPFTAPATRRADIADFLAGLGPADVPDLLDLVLDTARSADPGDVWADQRALLLQEALVAATDDPTPVLASMTAALDDPLTRGLALDVLGALALPAALPAVLGVLDAGPSEDDLVRAAAALGEIGGEPARAGLQRIVEMAPGAPDVLAEVEAALGALER